MACSRCRDAEHSYSEKPFRPPGGSVHDRTFTCSCGQRWWQYNDYYHLWSTVNDDATFNNIKGGCPEPVEIGNPSRNLY